MEANIVNIEILAALVFVGKYFEEKGQASKNDADNQDGEGDGHLSCWHLG